jgi:A/G-specific adenine glycosylase
MELGALICTPRNPQCLNCPVKKHCIAFKEDRIEELPNLGKRTTATARHFVAFIVERNGKFLVRQRPAGIVNAHLWEFPNFEVNGSKQKPEDIFQNHFAVEPLQIQPLHTVKHSITRYRITLEAFRVNLGRTSYTSPHSEKSKSGTRKARPSDKEIWLLPSEFDSLAFTAAHKKLASFAANRMLSRS